MGVAFFVSFLAIFFAFFGERSNRHWGLKTAMLIITVYWSIRYDFGNDYLGYLADYEKYNSYSFKLDDFANWGSIQSRGEFGWVILNKICGPIGFFGMVILLSVFECGVVYSLIKKVLDPNDYWLAISFFCLNPNFMLLGASMMRQWLAICISIIAIWLAVDRRKNIIPFFLIWVATTIHSSSVICLIFLIVSFFLRKPIIINKRIYIISALLLALFTILVNTIAKEAFSYLFTFNVLEGYSEYTLDVSDSGSQYGIGLVFNILLCFWSINNLKEDFPYKNGIAFFFFLSMFFIPLGFVAPMATRMALYLSVYGIVVIPMANMRFKKVTKDKMIPMAVLFVIIVYYFFIFDRTFDSIVWHDKLIEYHTIFEQPWQ